MNDSEQFDLPSGFADSPNSNADYEQLRSMFVWALVAMLIIGGTLNLFFVRQLVFMRKDLNVVRPQINQLLANYQKVEDPQIKNFVNSLIAYGRTHPDFNPILAKYKLVPEGAAAPAVPKTPTGVPTVPPAKKK